MQGVSGKSQNKLPTISPGVMFDSKAEKAFDKAKSSDIKFEKIFGDKDLVVFKLITECLFKPTEITLEILQKFSDVKIGHLTRGSLNTKEFDKKLTHVNFIYAITIAGTRVVQHKSKQIDSYKPDINVCNDSTQRNYFIVKKIPN